MPAGLWTNSNTAGKVRQATAVTLGGDLDIDASATWCTHGYDFEVYDLDIDAAGTFLEHGTETITVNGTTTGTRTTGSCYPYYVAIGSSWNDPADWLIPTGRTGIPLATDDVVFNASSASMTIDTTAVCASLTSTGYVNVLTQDTGQTLTVSGDIAWADGTFTGGDSAIQSQTFALTGSAVWDSTTGEFLLSKGSTYGHTFMTVTGTGFGHSSGTVKLIQTTGWTRTNTWNITAAIAFNNLTIASGSYGGSNKSTTLNLYGGVNPTVAGLLKIDTTGLYNLSMAGGTIECSGDISCIHGEMNGGTGTIKLTGTGTNTYTWSAGKFPHIEVAYGVGGSISPYTPVPGTPLDPSNTTDLAVTVLTMTNGEFVAPIGEFQISHGSMYGHTFLVVNGGTFTHNSGTVVFYQNNSWTDDANWIVASAIGFNNLTIHAGGYYTNKYTFMNLSGGTNPTVAGSLVIDPAPFYNLYMNGGTIECAGDVSCVNSYMHGGTTWLKLVGTGTNTYEWSAGQFPRFEVAYGSGGSISPHTPVPETPSDPSNTTNLTTRNFTLTSGAFTAPSDTQTIGGSNNGGHETAFQIDAGTFTHSSGRVKISVYDNDSDSRNKYVTINSPITFYDLDFDGGNIYGTSHRIYYVVQGTDTASVANDLSFLGPYDVTCNGGTIECGGNLACTSTEMRAGTLAIILNGTGDQTITQTAGDWPAGTWTNSNTAGVVLQATDVTLGGALDIDTDARWCMEGYDLTASSITNDGIIYRHGAGLPSPNPTPPALDESHIAGGTGPALLTRTATATMARQNSSKRSIGRSGNVLLRRRHRRLLG
jgi:hypothetical protein